MTNILKKLFLGLRVGVPALRHPRHVELSRTARDSRPYLMCLLVGVLMLNPLSAKPEINMRLQYPQQTNDVILTGVEGNSIVFRPRGRDTGGRAYLEMDELLRQRGSLNFLFPQAFYDAIEDLEQGQALKALPVIREYAQPFLEYMELSHLPGNLLPTVSLYMEALSEAGQWQEAAEVATRVPIRLAPVSMTDRLGDLALDLFEVNEIASLDKLHRHILGATELSDSRLLELIQLANAWREREEYNRAFDLYRKVQNYEGPHQTRARLWVAYCGFYMGQDLAPQVFLDSLPEMDVATPGFSLRELIKARLSLRENDYAAAMRSAAEGKTYAVATDSWYPELLYTVAIVYAHIDMNEAAIAAHRELNISFPDSPWAKQSSEALQKLTSQVSEL